MLRKDIIYLELNIRKDLLESENVEIINKVDKCPNIQVKI